MKQQWVWSLSNLCPGPPRTSLLLPPGPSEGKPAPLSTRAVRLRQREERPRYLQSILEGYKRSVVCLRAEDALGPVRRSAPTREIRACVTQAARHRPPNLVDLILTARPGIR